MILRAQNWREDRVWFHDVADRLRSLPANWTSTVAEDPFNVVAAGRAAFRVGELLELVRLIGEWKPSAGGEGVKLNTPQMLMQLRRR